MKTVERGAAFLDATVPDWFEKIDTDTLDLSSTCGCVLGQLYLAEHPRVRRENRGDAYERKVAELDLYDSRDTHPAKLGFSSYGSTRYENLTAAWRRLIEKRKQARIA